MRDHRRSSCCCCFHFCADVPTQHGCLTCTLGCCCRMAGLPSTWQQGMDTWLWCSSCWVRGLPWMPPTWWGPGFWWGAVGAWQTGAAAAGCGGCRGCRQHGGALASGGVQMGHGRQGCGRSWLIRHQDRKGASKAGGAPAAAAATAEAKRTRHSMAALPARSAAAAGWLDSSAPGCSVWTPRWGGAAAGCGRCRGFCQQGTALASGGVQMGHVVAAG
jgi:hypothetical protein